MLRAQEMLAKHKISLKEVEAHQKPVSVVDQRTDVTFKKAKWKGNLAAVVANNFGCYTYFHTQKNHAVVFMGKDEDVAVCAIVLDYALDFIKGLKTSFDKQKQDHQEWGLILVKDPAVIQKYKSKVFKKSLSTQTQYQGFKDVYYKGVEAGEKFSISDKITGRENEPILLVSGGRSR